MNFQYEALLNDIREKQKEWTDSLLSAIQHRDFLRVGVVMDDIENYQPPTTINIPTNESEIKSD